MLECLSAEHIENAIEAQNTLGQCKFLKCWKGLKSVKQTNGNAQSYYQNRYGWV